MEENRIAIRISGVKKQYRLGTIGGRTLQGELQSRWAKRLGREDPNTKLGTRRADPNKKFMALDGVDLTVYKGERIGIIGANGAGKSTLLKILSRITAPTEGEIDIYGRISSMLEIGTGFHGEMTGRENIYMNGAILGMTTEEIDEKIDKIIEFSEIGEFIDTPVKRYSSGMFVKLAFAVAAQLDSEILIMDEVLAVGDMAFQEKCLGRLREAAEKEGRTVLYVSHNMSTIRRLCDRCIVLSHGRVEYDGGAENAIALYMNQSIGGSNTEIDLSNRPASSNGSEKAVMLTHVSLAGKAAPVYESGESIKLAVALNVLEPTEIAKIRLTLRTDSDVGIATAWSEPFALREKGGHSLSLEINTDTLAKGLFYASIGVYGTDAIGRSVAIDHVTRAFKLEIEGEAAWSTNAHGYMKLPQIKLAGN